MNPTLAQLITAFRSSQDLAVMTLRDRLGIAMPDSNVHWATICHDLDLPQRGRSIGIAIRPHGYGVELTFPSLSIDFDWGDRGEAYGFDLWRLWKHCESNKLFPDTLTYNVLKHHFDNATAAGELVADRLLHYLPEERARLAPATTPASSAS